MTNNHLVSKRQEQQAALLKEALSRPGVSEYMEVYQGWQEQDQGLDPYRAATREVVKINTTNHANVSTLS